MGLIHECGMTHSYVRHDSIIISKWPLHVRDVTSSSVWFDSFVTFSSVWLDSFVLTQLQKHIWMSHVTHTNESCHTYEWVMSHIWMSHVTHIDESYHAYKLYYICTHIDESYRTHIRTCTHICTHIDESHRTHIHKYTHICTHIHTYTHIHTCWWVTSHTYTWLSTISVVISRVVMKQSGIIWYVDINKRSGWYIVAKTHRMPWVAGHFVQQSH